MFIFACCLSVVELPLKCDWSAFEVPLKCKQPSAISHSQRPSPANSPTIHSSVHFNTLQEGKKTGHPHPFFWKLCHHRQILEIHSLPRGLHDIWKWVFCDVTTHRKKYRRNSRLYAESAQWAKSVSRVQKTLHLATFAHSSINTKNPTTKDQWKTSRQNSPNHQNRRNFWTNTVILMPWQNVNIVCFMT